MARHAMQSMSYLARQPKGRFALVGEIAKAEKLPRYFLAKILQRLALRQLLVSRRGPEGGYALAMEPSAISLMEILTALDETTVEGFCFLENRICDLKRPCVMHKTVMAVSNQLQAALEKTTLDQLCQAAQS